MKKISTSGIWAWAIVALVFFGFIFFSIFSEDKELKEKTSKSAIQLCDDKINDLIIKVMNLENKVHISTMLAEEFGREFLKIHLPDCRFISDTSNPLRFWVPKICGSLERVVPNALKAKSIYIKIVRSQTGTGFTWKLDAVKF